MSLTEADASENDFKDVDEKNYQKITAKVLKVSYADGVANGRDSVFQKAFDAGYADGLQTAFELAKYKAFFEAANDDDKREMNAYKEMRLAEAINRAHFQYLKAQNKSPAFVSKLQQNYVDELAAKFETTLPLTADLLKRAQEPNKILVHKKL